MVETYLARGGVKGFINAELTEGKQVLPLKEVRAFIDTYNRHFLTNYRAEEFIVRDRLNEKKASYIDVKFNYDGDMKLVHGNISESSESQEQAKFDKLEREMEKKYGEGSVEGGVFKNANTHTSGRGAVTRKNI